MREKLKKITDLPRLPGARSAMFKDIEIAGATVRVHKAKARQTVPVSSRLLSLLGDELYQLIAHAEGEGGVDGGKLAKLLEIEIDNLDDRTVKNAVIGMVLPVLYEKFEGLATATGDGSIFWYFEQILAGNVELERVRPHSLDELDEMGFGVLELTKLFWAGIELALFPVRGAPDISTGNREPGAPETTQPRGTMSSPEESARETGQSARISMTHG